MAVRPYPAIPKRRYQLWRQEVLDWWRDYFRDVFGTSGEYLEDVIEERIEPHTINADEDDEEIINLL